jgi:hypothetical protein
MKQIWTFNKRLTYWHTLDEKMSFSHDLGWLYILHQMVSYQQNVAIVKAQHIENPMSFDWVIASTNTNDESEHNYLRHNSFFS